MIPVKREPCVVTVALLKIAHNHRLLQEDCPCNQCTSISGFARKRALNDRLHTNPHWTVSFKATVKAVLLLELDVFPSDLVLDVH